jgi:GNAT superfamily N-acetyltransferase
MGQIKIAKTDEEITKTHSVMIQLYDQLSELKESDYLTRVKLQQSEVGFQLAVLTEGEQTTCVAGFRLCRNLGWGKYLYVDDLVTDGTHRSRGAGKQMLDWLIGRARSEQCVELRLDAKVTRNRTHRFYLRERMDIVAFHFCLKL